MSRLSDLTYNISIRVPGFAAYYEREHGGSPPPYHAIHDLFSTLSHYLLYESSVTGTFDSERFWEWIGWQVESSDDEISEAVVVSFLEGIYDTDVEMRFRSDMPEIVTQWIDRVAGRKPRVRRT